MRRALCLILLAGSAMGETGAGFRDGLSNLLFAVRERAEATHYRETVEGGATSHLYHVDPPVALQHMVIDLGTAAIDYCDGNLFDVVHHPAVECQTNRAGSASNVICWTNYVDLTTETRDYCADIDGGVYLYGPVFASNFVLRTPTNLHAQFPGLADQYTPDYPSAHTLRVIDDGIKSLLDSGLYVDKVAIEEAGGLSAYFAKHDHTNHYWVDTNGDRTNDTWISVQRFPESLPVLTRSNAWRYARIEPVVSSIVTVTNGEYQVEGWTVGDEHSQLVTIPAGEVVTTTNFSYDFLYQPTVEVFRIELAQARIVATNSWVVTNAGTVVQYHGLGVGAFVNFGGMGGMPDDVPLRLIEGEAAGAFLLTAPGASNAVIPTELELNISGEAIDITGECLNLHQAAKEAVSGITAGTNALGSLWRSIESITSTWTHTESSTDAVPSLVGTTFSVIWSNTLTLYGNMPYTSSSDTAGAIALSDTGLAQRVAVLREMQWTLPTDLAHLYDWDGWDAYHNAQGECAQFNFCANYETYPGTVPNTKQTYTNWGLGSSVNYGNEAGIPGDLLNLARNAQAIETRPEAPAFIARGGQIGRTLHQMNRRNSSGGGWSDPPAGG